MSARNSVTLLAAVLLTLPMCAQQPKTEPPLPKTKVEAFEAQVGSVIIRGFSTIGSVSGEYGTSVSVESREYMNATSGKKEYGVVIEVKEGGRLERESSSYIDFDEIESLVRGIDYVAKITPDVTRMENFQADYRTKGDLRISTYSSNGTVQAAVASGTIGGARAFLSLANLTKLRELIEQAKSKIDTLKSVG